MILIYQKMLVKNVVCAIPHIGKILLLFDGVYIIDTERFSTMQPCQIHNAENVQNAEGLVIPCFVHFCFAGGSEC